MFNDLKRNFRRAAKNLRHEPLTIDDLTTIRPMNEPGTTYQVRARRQHDSEYWKIYGPGNMMLPREWCRSTRVAGLTLQETLDKLEEIENGYADALRGKKNRPYNHFSKVRDMLAAEEAAANAAPAANTAPPALETQAPVSVKGPLTLKKLSA